MSKSALTENGPLETLARSTRYPVALATAFQRRLISPEPALGPALMTSTAFGTADLVVVVVDRETVVVEVDGGAVVVDIDVKVVVEAAMPPLSSPPHAAAVTPITSKTASFLAHRCLSFTDTPSPSVAPSGRVLRL
jgi:hypothetical protein